MKEIWKITCAFWTVICTLYLESRFLLLKCQRIAEQIKVFDMVCKEVLKSEHLLKEINGMKINIREN